MSSWFLRYDKAVNPTCRVICFHPAGGSASQFRTWTEYFSDEVSIVALQLPGREDRFNDKQIMKFSLLIPLLAKEVISYLNLPYVIIGHSLGALIGFELIRYFQLNEYPLPKFLIVAAKEPPHFHCIPSKLEIINDEWLIERLKAYKAIPELLFQTEEFKEIFLPYIRSDFLLLNSYQYNKSTKLKIPILVLHGSEDKTVSLNKLKNWAELTESNFQLRAFKGGHFFIKEAEKKVLGYLSPFLLGRNKL